MIQHPNLKLFYTPKAKRKIAPLKLHENVLNRIKNEEQDINNHIFKE